MASPASPASPGSAGSPATPGSPTSFVTRASLDLARAAFCERLYRGRSVLCIGLGDGAALDVVLARGAARVAGVDMDEATVAAAQRRLGEAVALRVGLLGEAAALGAPFDVVLVRRGETMVARDLWRDVARLVRPGGWLVAAALAGDHPEAPRGAMRYQQLREHAAAYFPHVTMLAQAGFAGAALIPFGGGEVEPVLDTALAGEPTPELYVAVAGPEPLALPYGLVELGPGALTDGSRPSEGERGRAPGSLAELERLRAQVADVERLRAQVADGERLRALLAERDGRLRQLEAQGALVDELRQALADREARLRGSDEQLAQQAATAASLVARDERLAAIEAERRALLEELERRTGAGGMALSDLRDQIASQQQAIEAARAAALVHAEEMRSLEAVIAERDAYLAELEVEVRGLDEVREAAQRASRRADDAEASERRTRRRVAELEGIVLRLEAGGDPVAPTSGAAPALALATAPVEAVGGDAELRVQVAELEARCARLQQKADEAQREAWAHLRSRSEAEAAAAEVREDTVRKLKDARKIANVELMRAMEEATRKAVSLREELTRCQRDRDQAEAEVRALRAELAGEREGTAERVQRAAAVEAARVLGELEARLLAAEAERDRALDIAREATAGSSGAPGVVARAAAEVEALLGGIGRTLEVENRRLEEVERGLRRAVDEIGRTGEADPAAPDPGSPDPASEGAAPVGNGEPGDGGEAFD